MAKKVQEMKQNDLGTIGGKPITQEMLDEFAADFERDWADSEIEVRPTSHGKALAALQALDIPVGEIEALERRARHERQPLSFFVRSILQNELAS